MTPTLTPGQIINSLQPGAFVTLGKVPGGGSLEARRITAGVQFYWRYTAAGKTDRVAVGPYDSSAPPKSLKPSDRGYSVQAAIRAAEEMSAKHRAAIEQGGYRAAAQAAAQARTAAQAQTLDKLLTDYCDHLETLGRTAHRDARSIFNLHIREAWPKLAASPAAKITTEDVADMMRKVLEKGKGRTANKLRSYLRAAYQTAKAARTKASVPVHFKDFGITSNPAAEAEADNSHNVPDKHPLSTAELRSYWAAIKDIPGIRGAALRVHLLTGGQRIEQLVNLRTANIVDGSITLHDGKGRPGGPPRPHTVPLSKRAAAALKECQQGVAATAEDLRERNRAAGLKESKPFGVFALSTDGGQSHIGATTLSAWAVEAAGEAIPEFQAKRIRSGVETLLAASRVSQEVRGRLQSHGISGVQARHYDGHDYMAEKLAALTTLEKALLSR